VGWKILCPQQELDCYVLTWTVAPPPPAENSIFLTNESLQPIVNSFLETASLCSCIPLEKKKKKKKGMLAGVVRE
jgi:hypothetical protein